MSTRLRKVNCFGDSFTYGYGDREHYKGWAGQLKEEFHKVNEVDGVDTLDLPAFYNLGLLGGTALKVYGQALREKTVRARRGHMMLNILSIGLNDSATRTDGSSVTTEKEFVDQVQKITDILTDDDATMLHIGLTSFDDSLTINFRGRGVMYSKNRAHHYEGLALEISEEKGIETIPLFENSNTDEFRTSMLDKDGLHPNTHGHEWVYRQVRGKASKLWGLIDG